MLSSWARLCRADVRSSTIHNSPHTLTQTTIYSIPRLCSPRRQIRHVVHPAWRTRKHIRGVRPKPPHFPSFSHHLPLPSSSNPLGCAIAQTALRVLVDEDMSSRALKLGEIFRSGVRELQQSSPGGKLIRQVRGRGLFNAVVIKELEVTVNGKKVVRTAWDVCLRLKERGVLAKPTHGDIIRFSPPIVIEEEDLKSVVKIIGEVLGEIVKEGEVA